MRRCQCRGTQRSRPRRTVPDETEMLDACASHHRRIGLHVAHQSRFAFSLDDDSNGVSTSIRRPAAKVAGCIHDTYPMIVTCTTIHPRRTAAAANAPARARRCRLNTRTAVRGLGPQASARAHGDAVRCCFLNCRRARWSLQPRSTRRVERGLFQASDARPARAYRRSPATRGCQPSASDRAVAAACRVLHARTAQPLQNMVNKRDHRR